MNKLLYIIGIAALLAACDEVDEGDRYIYVPPRPSQRAVLLEDFTGQKCVNCPDATDVIHRLTEQYTSDSVIAVAIHGGNFGIDEAKGGLATEEARAYYDHWNVQAQPNGVINRQGGLQPYQSWATAVAAQIRRETFVALPALTAQADGDSLRVSVRAFSAIPLKGKLQLWLTEDSIIGRQLMPDGSANKAYVHNHIFRRSLNGTWGTDITLETDTLTQQFAAPLDSKYNRQQLSVVAFIYNDGDGVYQVRKVKVE